MIRLPSASLFAIAALCLSLSASVGATNPDDHDHTTPGLNNDDKTPLGQSIIPQFSAPALPYSASLPVSTLFTSPGDIAEAVAACKQTANSLGSAAPKSCGRRGSRRARKVERHAQGVEVTAPSTPPDTPYIVQTHSPVTVEAAAELADVLMDNKAKQDSTRAKAAFSSLLHTFHSLYHRLPKSEEELFSVLPLASIPNNALAAHTPDYHGATQVDGGSSTGVRSDLHAALTQSTSKLGESSHSAITSAPLGTYSYGSGAPMRPGTYKHPQSGMEFRVVDSVDGIISAIKDLGDEKRTSHNSGKDT